MTEINSNPKLIKAGTLARHLECGKSTIYRMVKEGQIPAIRIGETGLRFDLEEVLSVLKKQNKGIRQ